MHDGKIHCAELDRSNRHLWQVAYIVIEEFSVAGLISAPFVLVHDEALFPRQVFKAMR